MRIFISWSGERSRLVAEALRDWLPLVLQFSEPWLSNRDIQPGERWAVEVGKELEDARFGVIVLTRDSLSSPWILFEAGALSKAFSSAGVCPLLVDLDFRDLSGPLSQFQAKKIDKESILELVETINGRGTSPVPSQRLVTLYDALWPKFEDEVARLPVPQTTHAPTRKQVDILEDLVASVRRMEARLNLFVNQRHLPQYYLTVDIDGSDFPGIEEGVESIRLNPGNDVITDIASIAELDQTAFGESWHLSDKRTGRMLERDDGRPYARLARGRPVHLILTRVPF